jgi:antitoxin protein of toxin-antitoxin system
VGFLDKLKDQASGLKDMAVTTASKNSDKITVGLDKAGEFVDKRTKGKYTDKIETGKVKAKEGLQKLDAKNTPPSSPPPSPPQPDAFGTSTPGPVPGDPDPTPPPLS